MKSGGCCVSTFRRVIGLMSGTSADGVDAALVEVGLAETRVRLVAFTELPYPPELRQEILEVSEAEGGNVAKICRLHVILGEWFARAAFNVCRKAGVEMSNVDLIGSHGQTVHHLPEAHSTFGVVTRSSLQIADPCVIAERTGVTTVADFRARDLAVGGQGAPLVPLVDYLLFRSRREGRVLLNIGGISNVTVLPTGCGPEDVMAFDTGPGNMMLDALTWVLTGGRLAYDAGGAFAASGEVSDSLLAEMMRHPFLKRVPPKSTGRETFGASLVRNILARRGRVPDEDLIATATAFTARSIADALKRFVLPVSPIGRMAVSGGGGRNAVIMDMLRGALPGLDICQTDALGVPSDAKEAIAFAVLANATVEGRPGNLPGATGASKPVVLGVVAPGRRCGISIDSTDGFV